MVRRPNAAHLGHACAAFIALALAASAHAQSAPGLAQAGVGMSDVRPVEVDADGTGQSEDAAVAKALSNAVAQQTGTDVAQINVSGTLDAHAAVEDATKTTTQKTGQSGWNANSKPQGTTQSTSDQASAHAQTAGAAVVTFSGGRVASYSILSVSSANGLFTARVHAVLELYKRRPSAADLRKSIAVTPIASDDNSDVGRNLHDLLVIDLTQANRFAVVDRSHDADYDNELAMIQSGETSPEARSHAGQALGADFILTGKMHMIGAHTAGHAAHTTVETLELTGEQVSHTSASTLHTIPGNASAEFQVIELATRQIVLADRISLTGASVEGLAQQITNQVIGTIYPPRLIRADDPNALIISQGGSGMHPGDRFRMMSEGEEMFDPYTHESLGKTEHQSGVLELTDVEPRMSYAKVVDGAVPPGAAVVLRPVPPVAPSKPVQVAHRRARPAAEPPDDTGGVRLPGDH